MAVIRRAKFRSLLVVIAGASQDISYLFLHREFLCRLFVRATDCSRIFFPVRMKSFFSVSPLNALHNSHERSPCDRMKSDFYLVPFRCVSSANRKYFADCLHSTQTSQKTTWDSRCSRSSKEKKYTCNMYKTKRRMNTLSLREKEYFSLGLYLFKIFLFSGNALKFEI